MGTIGRADLDGLNATQSLVTGASNPAGMAAGTASVYWTNNGGNTIGRVDLDGQNASQTFITGASGPRGVAVTSH
ncbi:MAG TPA: hypothetical protein VGF54_01045 [Streptosporangiaceae bacterium]